MTIPQNYFWNLLQRMLQRCLQGLLCIRFGSCAAGTWLSLEAAHRIPFGAPECLTNASV